MKGQRSVLLRRVDRRVLQRAAEIIKLLGHRERLMILEALESGERTVSDIFSACGLEQAICSQHLSRLRQLKVVACRKDGLNVYYRVVEPKVHHILNCIRTCDAPQHH
jgi:ArsR family transcriptional regulator